jgi:predicted nucleotidyltransferase
VVPIAERGPASPTTAFPELKELLRELMARVQAVLEDNFVGAYLQGSFAIGDADLHSDCDFIVVTKDTVTQEQEQALRQLHDEIPTREGHWTHNLEGSYAPRRDLETLEALGRPWLYIDHGWREMQWSTHCNTEVVRWTLREHGVTLVGPDARDLVCEVPGDALRRRMCQMLGSFLPDLQTWTSLEVAWSQRYAVTTLCRMLHTLDTGEVASKPASLEWAKSALDPQWHGLLQQVIDDRKLGWNPSDPPRPGSVDATTALAQHAKERAAESGLA